MRYVRTAAAGPKAPEKLKRALSGPDYESTLSRLGRATRRQNKEFSASVHPLSGRVMDMRRGNGHSVGFGHGVAQGHDRKSKQGMARLYDRTSNPAIKSRIESNFSGNNKNLVGPKPVLVHNHPENHGLKRAYPSAQDTDVAPHLPNNRHVVLSRVDAPRGGKKTSAVTTRVDLAEHQRSGNRLQDKIMTQDLATQPEKLAAQIGNTGAVRSDAQRRAKQVTAVSRSGAATRSPMDYDRYVRSKTRQPGASLQTRQTFHKARQRKKVVNPSENEGTKPGQWRRVGSVGGGTTWEQIPKDYERVQRRKARAAGVAKADPLKTHMKERDAKRVVRQYGLAGELPKHLTREQRMGAYEARYVSAGGRKGERWQRRAERSDKIKTAGLGVATAGGAAWLATRTKSGGALAARKISPQTKFHADNVAVGGATVGGAAELDAARARRKRASYASAPGGAAASALRRMRAMDAAKGTA